MENTTKEKMRTLYTRKEFSDFLFTFDKWAEHNAKFCFDPDSMTYEEGLTESKLFEAMINLREKMKNNGK